MKRFAVFGNPINHSLSPIIHNKFANEFGIELSYEKILSPIGDFALTANEFIKDGGLGFNITVPFKLDAFNFCEELTSNARAAGAVNTIKVQNKVIYGENTDGNGLVNDLENNLGESLGGKEILIIGAGAAVESILFRLVQSNPSEITILNRTPEKARRLCTNYPNHRFQYLHNEEAQYDIIINGSSAGLTGSFNPPKEIKTSNETIFYDLNYSLGKTPFCEWASESSKNVYDGTGMLVNQAAQSFKLWFGVNPETDKVSEDLKSMSE